MTKRVGVIGAGIAGAWIANQLSQHGHEVVVFEKSRGFGGRMATRRTENLAFDHGAQFFTARTDEFRSVINAHPEQVSEWKPRVETLGEVSKPFKRDWFEPHYVCVPGMGALCRQLLSQCQVELQTEVKAAYGTSEGWQLVDQEGRSFDLDWVISTAPAEQTQKLFPEAPLDQVRYSPCFALMAALESRPHYDAAVIRGRVLEWLAISDSRPERAHEPGLVAHATAAWSEEHFDDDKDQLRELLVEELADLGISVGAQVSLHRWRYARVSTPSSEPYWLDEENHLAACGDWGRGPRVEDAFSSANQLLHRLTFLTQPWQ